MAEDGGPAYPKVIPALEEWGATDQPAESGFGIAFGLDAKDGKDSVFRFVAEDGEGDKKGFRMKRIGNAMEGMKGDGAYNVGHVHKGFDWSALGEATVVDVSLPMFCPWLSLMVSSLFYGPLVTDNGFSTAWRISWPLVHRNRCP